MIDDRTVYFRVGIASDAEGVNRGPTFVCVICTARVLLAAGTIGGNKIVCLSIVCVFLSMLIDLYLE